jgi:hypothetical protein
MLSWLVSYTASDNQPPPSLFLWLAPSLAELLLLIGEGVKAGNLVPENRCFWYMVIIRLGGQLTYEKDKSDSKLLLPCGYTHSWERLGEGKHRHNTNLTPNTGEGNPA